MSGGRSRPASPGSKPMSNELITIPIYKGTDPYYGMNTDIDGTALRKGEYAALNNLRGSRGAIKSRGGIDPKNQTGITTGTYRGRIECTLNGTYEQLVAIESASSTLLYYGPDTAFSEYTASSGKYGNTRLSSEDVTFVVCRDVTNSTLAPFNGKSGRDLVLASDGTSIVVWDPSANEAAKHVKIAGPSKGVVFQQATFPTYLNMSTGNVTTADVGGHTTTVDNAALPTYLGLTPSTQFATTVVAGDYSELTFASGAAIADGAQVKILYSCTDTEIWQKIKLSIYSGSYKVLYDPATQPTPDIIPCSKGMNMAVFRVDSSVVPSGTYTKVKFEWATGSTAPASAQDVYWLGIFGGGTLPGGTSFSLTRFNSGSRAESQREVCKNGEGKWVRNLGLQDKRNDIQLPISADCLYAFDITANQVNNADRDAGVDYLLIYALLPGTDSRNHVASYQMCDYNVTSANAWARVSSVAAGSSFTTQVNSDVLFGRQAPDDLCRAIPPFKCATFSGSRLFVGAAKSTDSTSGQSVDVFISEQQYPFRFREEPRFIDFGVIDPTSATRIVFPGEVPKQIRALSSQGIGAQPVLVWTERALWVIDGVDAYSLSFARRIGPHGTLSPRSVAIWDDRAFWLDQHKQLKTFNGQIQRLSYNRVDAPLNAIPDSRLAYAAGFFFRDEYFLGYTIGGGSANTNILVYDVMRDVFHGRWPSNNTDYTYADFHAKGNELRFWTEAGNLCQHDSTQPDDNGTPIPINITTADIPLDMWIQAVFGDVGIVCDDCASSSLTCTWTGRTTGQTSSATSSIDEVTDPMVYRWIGKGGISNGKFGTKDVAASLTITGSMPANKKIVAIVAKINPGSEPGADSV